MLMAEYYTGCSGFYYREWKHYFYPDHLAVKDWFRYYTEHFNTVEINASFYRLPRLLLLKRWYELSPVHFRFSIKAPRIITHFKQFRDVAADLNEFYELCTLGLQDKLGCILFQLPATLRYHEDLLALICTQLNSEYHNVIEFRHASWWHERVYQKLRQSNITFCNSSYPGLPTDFIQSNSTIYTRYHGVPKLYYSGYSKDELIQLTEQIRRSSAETVYTYFNNTADGEAIGNGRWLQHHLIKT